MLKDEINRIIEKTAEELGYMIYEKSALLRGEDTKIVVKLDSMDGISHKDCENFSKKLDFRLEESELIPNYTLEVSSPGLNRKLRNLEEVERFIDSPVKIIYQDENNRVVHKGVVTGLENERIKIRSENRDIILEYKNVVEAFLDY
jgi:ribosome maturation factor RimP